MRTLIALENSNCSWCHNNMLEMLREQYGVEEVQSDFTSGCLAIEHEDDSIALLALVTGADHAVVVASNGEREMIPVDGHEVIACREMKHSAASPLAAEESTDTVMRLVGKCTGSISNPLPSDAEPSASLACPVCHPDEPGGQAGVRVLTREQRVSGPVIRTVQALTRRCHVGAHWQSVTR